MRRTNSGSSSSARLSRARSVLDNKELARNLRSLSERALEFEGRELLSKAMRCGEIKLIQAVFDQRPFEQLKSLAGRIVDAEPAVVLFGNRGQKAQLVFSCSEGLPYRMDELMSDACLRLDGRGGGSPHLAFGGGRLAEKVEEAIQQVSEHIQKSRE